MHSFLDVPVQGLLACEVQNGQNYRKLAETATKLINSLRFLDKWQETVFREFTLTGIRADKLCEAIQLVGLALCMARDSWRR
jgi:hypothetical protein